MKKAIAWMARNSVAANLLMLLILMVGLVSFTNVVQEVFPEASLDMVQVRIEYLGASPEKVEEGVVRRIEEQIESLAEVASVVIVGLPHQRLGEYCCACVVPENGAEPTLEQICEHLKKAGFATYKFPQRLELLDELPATVSGKIQRHRLVAAFADNSD